jgi:hypothetical protein
LSLPAAVAGGDRLTLRLTPACRAIPSRSQSAAIGAYQAANAKVDLEARAELISPEQAKAAKEANARKALAGGYGALSEEGILTVRGDLAEFAKALENATNSLEEHDKAIKEVTKSLNEFNNASSRLTSVELATMTKALADTISGQIAGISYAGRQMTPGVGSAARY